MTSKKANLYLCVAAVTHRNGKNIHSMSDAVHRNPRAFSGFTNRVEITSKLSGLSATLLKLNNHGSVDLEKLDRNQRILLRESLQELIADLREDNVSDDIKEILRGIPGLESLDEKVIYDLYVSINL